MAALLSLSCAEGEGSSAPAPGSEGGGDLDASSRGAHPPPLVFSVRGRLEAPSDLTYRLELDGSPVDEPAFREAVAEAAALWNVPGRVSFRPAREGELAAITLGFRRGTHERGCPSFGTSRSVAHTGPVSMDTFVHFDAGRRWREARGDGPSLRLAATHELGHVLGLDHVSRSDALMFADPQDPALVPTPSDLAGLHSLYGGGTPPSGSLAVRGSDDSERLVLFGVAPQETHEWTLFDVDGDGADELVTWRTDAPGHGELTVFRFGPGPALELTVGPQLGLTSPRAVTLLGRGDDGTSQLVAVFPDGRYGAHRFEPPGRARPFSPEALRLELHTGVFVTDDDGDGTLDGEIPIRSERRSSGDLDGDGSTETLVSVGESG